MDTPNTSDRDSTPPPSSSSEGLPAVPAETAPVEVPPMTAMAASDAATPISDSASEVIPPVVEPAPAPASTEPLAIAPIVEPTTPARAEPTTAIVLAAPIAPAVEAGESFPAPIEEPPQDLGLAPANAQAASIPSAFLMSSSRQAAPVEPVPEAPVPAPLKPRGESRLHPALAVLALVVAAMLMTLPGWFPKRVLAPTDALKVVAPWEHPSREFHTPNEQLLDQTVQFVPWTLHTVDRFKRGEIPLWNPYSQNGAPFLANGQSAVFYPTIFLHWGLPETWSWTISAALRVFLAGLGVWVLAGMYGQRHVPRLMSALTFELCGFVAVWMNHPHMNVMPLLPWAIVITEALLRRVTLVRVLLGTMIFAVQFLGGHPSSSVHLLLTCAIVLGLRFVWPRTADACCGGAGTACDAAKPRDSEPSGGLCDCPIARWLPGALGFAAIVVFGFALAAAQWLPMIEYARNSGAHEFRHYKLENAKFFEFNPRYLVGMVFPYANGYPPDGVTPFEMRKATGLPNTNELAAGFVGIIPLLLGIYGAFACRREKSVRIWTIVAVAAALIATSFPLIDQLVRRIPALNISQNARLLVVTGLGLALLSGFGLQALLTRLREGVDLPRVRKSLFVAAGSIAAVALLSVVVLLIAKGWMVRKYSAKVEQDYKATTDHEHSLEQVKALVPRVHTELVLTSARLLIPAAVLALAAMLLLRARRQPGCFAASAWPWLGLAVVDLLAFSAPYNRGSAQDTYYPPPWMVPGIKQLGHLVYPNPASSAPPTARFTATHRTLFPETSTPYGLPDIRGYDALSPAGYHAWWSHPELGNPNGKNGEYMTRWENPSHKAWSLLNLGYVVTAPDQPAPPAEQWKLATLTGDLAIYQATKLRPRAWVVPMAQVHRDLDEVVDRVAKFDFDPDKVVLLDAPPPYGRQVASRWPDPQLAVVSGASPVSPLAPLAAGLAQSAQFVTGMKAVPGPKVEWLPPASKKMSDQRPEVVRLGVSGVRGGWLVLADSWAPGWSVSIVNTASGVGREFPCVRAYGALRAVPLPRDEVMMRNERGGGFGRGGPGRGPEFIGGRIIKDCDPTGQNPGKVLVRTSGRDGASDQWVNPGSLNPASLTIEFVYKPWSWRIGWIISCSALALLALLWGAALFTMGRRTA